MRKREFQKGMLFDRLLRSMVIFCLMLYAGCQHSPRHVRRSVEPSVYYWQTNFRISETQKAFFDSLEIRNLFVKYFDVTWDDQLNAALPVAQLQSSNEAGTFPANLQIIPVIFITNEVLFKTNDEIIDSLGNNIYRLLRQLHNGFTNTAFTEIQIDCDWTASTRDKYFALLKKLKLLSPTTMLSATIRLHQVKFSSRTGVPPVDRGMLMCYNMGNLTGFASHNSILEIDELKKYIGALDKYPLPLDAAFPLFDWTVHFRQQKFAGILSGISDSMLADRRIFSRNNNRFTSLNDSRIAGYDIRKADLLRRETCSYADIIQAVKLVKALLPPGNIRVALYHADELLLKKYTIHELENIYSGMR